MALHRFGRELHIKGIAPGRIVEAVLRWNTEHPGEKPFSITAHAETILVVRITGEDEAAMAEATFSLTSSDPEIFQSYRSVPISMSAAA